MTSTQRPLPIKVKAAPTEQTMFGLIVDEIKLNSLGSEGGTWWATYAARFATTGRERILSIIIPGALAEYGPFDRETADFMHSHMVEHGVHRATLKIRPWIADLPDCTRAGRCKRCGRSHHVAQKPGAPE